MANRYWVGGTAAWDGTAGTKWALTSGGAGGQPIPTSADDVFFDSFSSPATTVTISTGNTGAKSITCTGFAGRLAGTSGLIVSGSVTLSSAMLFSYTGVLTINATGTLTTANQALGGSVTCSATGGTVTLGDALSLTGTLTVNAGGFTTSASNYSITCGIFNISSPTTRTVNLNSSVVTVTSAGTAFNANTTTGLTFSGSGTIRFTNASAKTFSCTSGFNFGNLTVINASSTQLTFTGSNTIGTLSNSVQPTIFQFTAGTTTTITNWNVSGTAGNLVTIQSPTAATHTLSKASGTVSANYLNIINSIATGGAAWYAGANSTNGGGNTGWIFTNPPITAAMAASEVGPDILAADAFIGYRVTAAMAASEVGPDIFAGSAIITSSPTPVAGGVLFIELRSFTERRRF